MASRSFDAVAVQKHATALCEAGADEARFEAAKAGMIADAGVTSREVIKVAKEYAGKARRITSRKGALEAIDRRFIDKVRSNRKLDMARSSRPW